MAQGDLDINRGIRRVLVRHWIDLGRVSIRSIKGAVYVRGYLIKIAGNESTMTTQVVENIFREIKRVDGVKRLKTELENWLFQDGTWIEVGKKTSGQPTREQEKSTGDRIDIKE